MKLRLDHTLLICYKFMVIIIILRRQGGGGLHENFAEIDFMVVSDRGDRYLSDVFGPMKNIVPSRNYSHLKVSATV